MNMRELDNKVLAMMSNPVPEEVRTSDFGCPNCLWCSIECKNGSMYKSEDATRYQCENYTYYD